MRPAHVLLLLHLAHVTQLVAAQRSDTATGTASYDGRKVTTYTTHQWYVVLEVFCVVYVGKPPTQHVVVGLPTCVVGGKPTTTCCCWFTNMCCWR